MPTRIIRLATPEDSGSLLEIYAPFISNTAVTFECAVPSVGEFRERIERIAAAYPWIVCGINDSIAGYAYASRYGEREAYQWSVNLSVYVKEEYRGKGIARTLYLTLFELLKALGYFRVYAGITLPNIKSEKFHESLGFRPVGIYHHVGYKLGQWHNVIWYESSINKGFSEPPAKPLPIEDADVVTIIQCLQRNIGMIRI